MEQGSNSHFIHTPQRLKDLCRRVRAARRLGLDTEFVSERRFSPDLGIIQVAVEDECAIIDPQTLPDLNEFCELLCDSNVEKVFHAGRQDLEIFYRLGGEVPSPIFDTQIAAALVGYGEQVSYARLVEEAVGVTLVKNEGFTDWRVRPLSADQVEYALDDVRYLLSVAKKLRSDLRRLGRTGWAKEEFARIGEDIFTARTSPHERYRQVRRWTSLSRQNLAVLRELASWREQEAERKNRPRGRVIPDEVLIELARRSPADHAGLKKIRALNPGIVKRQGDELLQAIQKGLDVPKEELPRVPKRKAKVSTPPPGLVDLLSTVLRARAEQMKIAPGLLAKRSDLECLATDPSSEPSLPVLQGWRFELVGKELLDVLKGQCRVGFDLEDGKVKTFPLDDAQPSE
ncbi:MAG: ribonuclease D [bacterium]